MMDAEASGSGPSGVVTYLIGFAVRPGEMARFLRLLTDVLDAMSEEAMFVHAALHMDPVDESRFLLLETWRDYLG